MARVQKTLFEDADRDHRDHDLAVRYLLQPKIAAAVVSAIWPGRPSDAKVWMESELALLSGRGQAAGYALPAKYEGPVAWVDVLYRFNIPGDAALIVEVKVSERDIGQAIRQLKAYQMLVPRIARGLDLPPFMALATTFRMCEPEVALLKANNIHWIHLGAAFFEWKDAAVVKPGRAKVEL